MPAVGHPSRKQRVCIVGASGKLGQYLVQHALDRDYEVVAVCRQQSIGKLKPFQERIEVVPGATNDRELIKRAVAGCDGALVVLAPWGVNGYSTGTAQAVLDYAPPEARLPISASSFAAVTAPQPESSSRRGVVCSVRCSSSRSSAVIAPVSERTR